MALPKFAKLASTRISRSAHYRTNPAAEVCTYYRTNPAAEVCTYYRTNLAAEVSIIERIRHGRSTLN
jgi:hypothetical protein